MIAIQIYSWPAVTDMFFSPLFHLISHLMQPINLSSYNKNHHLDGKYENDPNPPIPTVQGEFSIKTPFKFLFGKTDVDTSLPVRNPVGDFKREPGIRVFWIGHATNLIQINDIWIITDPIFSNHASPVPYTIRRVTPPPCTIEDLPEISLILLSHDHYDHLCADTMKKLYQRFPNLITFAPLGVAELIEGWGYKSIAFDWRQRLAFKGIEITCYPARHYCSRYGYDRGTRLCCSFLLKYNNVTIFYPGDTAIGPHFTEIREDNGAPIDLALMPIGPQNPQQMMRAVHLDPKEAYEMSLNLEAKDCIPIHYGTFPLGTAVEISDVELLRKEWKKDNIHILPAGGFMEWNGERFVVPEQTQLNNVV